MRLTFIISIDPVKGLSLLNLLLHSLNLQTRKNFDVVFYNDYVEKVTRVLETTGFDILLGNLSRTSVDGSEIMDILKTDSVAAFSDYLCTRKLREASHWGFSSCPA